MLWVHINEAREREALAGFVLGFQRGKKASYSCIKAGHTSAQGAFFFVQASKDGLEKATCFFASTSAIKLGNKKVHHQTHEVFLSLSPSSCIYTLVRFAGQWVPTYSTGLFWRALVRVGLALGGIRMPGG